MGANSGTSEQRTQSWYEMTQSRIQSDGGSRLVFSDEHFHVALMEDVPILVVKRLPRRFASRMEVEASFTPMLDRLDMLGRHGKALLMDSREALPNNDPEYEVWMAPYRRELIRGYAWAVFVLKSQIGELQSRRLLKQDDIEGTSMVFHDYDEALQFLLERKDSFRRRTSVLPGKS